MMCLPAVGQGALAIETRADDAALRASLAFLQDEDTVRCARAERSFLRRVEGGCQVPVGVYASPEEAGLRVGSANVSRQHARLTPAGDEVLVEDLGSANGTYIGSQRIAPNTPTLVPENEVVRAGDVEVRFVPAEAPRPAAQPSMPAASVAAGEAMRYGLL